MAGSNGVERAALRAAHPFDAVAGRYDAAFTDQLLGRWLRSAVWARLEEQFAPGDHVLDLGCGTGEDAVWLARRGVSVTAVDASPGMLAVAGAKAREAGVADQITFARLDLRTAAAGFPTVALRGSADSLGRFDGALSDFGPLNCLPDRRPLAEALAGAIRPGGTLVTVVMGPLCPWEIAWYLAHGHPRTALRRFRAGRPARVGSGAVPVWYPSPRRLRREFAPAFDHRETVGVGLLLPPSDLGRLVARRPQLFRSLRALETRLAGTWAGVWLSDHYLSVFVRRDARDGRR